MPKNIDYTIAYDSGNGVFDLFKVLFGGDGSYYITAPYHPLDRAIAARVTVNYAEQDGLINLDAAEEVVVVDDDDRRLKVSHHPDGLLQFSGQGVRSGLAEDGTPKGIGVFSWPLTRPALGPSFQLAFSDPTACGRPTAQRPRTITFREIAIEHLRKNMIGLTFRGYYLPVMWREFVFRADDGSMWMHLLNPVAQATIRLRVLLASKDSDIPGFIGLEALPHGFEQVGDQPTFFISTSTGNLRRNDAGELLGDQLFCMYPQLDVEDANLPSLNYPLPAPPYIAPPGTKEIFPPS
jgi:hypothetical protein